MRILCVTSSYPTAMNSIAGNFVHAHVKGLRAMGHTVDVIATNMFSAKDFFKWVKYFPGRGRDEFVKDCFYSSSTINIWPLGPWFHQYWFTKKINKAIRQCISQKGSPDVVHAHFILWAGYACTKSELIKNVPLVVTEHSSLFYENKVTLVEMIVAGETLKRADAIICPSDFMKKSLTKNINGYDSKMVLIPNIAEEMFFDEYDFSTKSDFIISVGRMVKSKGFDTLIEAFSKLKIDKNYKLVLVGEGDELEGLKAYARQMGLVNKVIFTGTISKSELADWLRKSKILVSASHFETFGISIAEAMATGTPVLVTDVGAPSGFVIPGTGDICKVRDVNDTALKLQRMLDNYKEFSSSRIRQYAYNSFSQKSVASQTIAVYKKVIDK